MQEERSTIFLSYARADSEFALKVATDLRAAGARIWIDQLDIQGGERWDMAIESALTSSPSFLIVLSPTAVSSDNVKDEFSLAIDQKKRIFPILFQSCQIPFRLKRFQYVDFTSDYEAALERLKTTLGITAQKDLPHALEDSEVEPGPDEDSPALVVESPFWQKTRQKVLSLSTGQKLVFAAIVLSTLAVCGYGVSKGLRLLGDQKPFASGPTTTQTPSVKGPVSSSPLPVAGADSSSPSPVSQESPNPPTTGGAVTNPLLERHAQLGSYSIINHILIDPAGQPISPIPAHSLAAGLEPRFIVFHFTASGSLNGVANFMASPETRVSAHLLIDRSGKVIQTVPFDYIAHHVGGSSYKGVTNLSKYSIGIELINWGQLEQSGNSWRTFTGKEVPASEVFLFPSGGTGWQNYTDEQIRTASLVCQALVRSYPGIQEIIGHENVLPARGRSDPGPAFPMEAIRKSVFGK